jgi:hypothetical protein
MFRHYCVILREFVVGTLPSYTSMAMQLLVIRVQFNILHMIYAVEVSAFKIFKILIYLAISYNRTILIF